MWQNNFSPYPNMQIPQHHEIIHVNGRGGAEAFQMAPNSQALLMDDTAPLVWLVQTDGAGYKTTTPFDVKLHEEPAPIDMNAILQRLDRLESAINGNKPDAQSSATAAVE